MWLRLFGEKRHYFDQFVYQTIVILYCVLLNSLSIIYGSIIFMHLFFQFGKYWVTYCIFESVTKHIIKNDVRITGLYV